MHVKTTVWLFLAVIGIAAFIWFAERDSETGAARERYARKLFAINADAIHYLRLENEERVIECEKQENQWMISRPVRTGANAGEITRILTALERLPKGEVISGDEFKEGRLRLSEYGLSRPRLRITVGDYDGRRTLLIGRDAVLGDRVYVKWGHRPDIISVPESVKALTSEELAALRDPVVFHARSFEVTRMEIHREDGFLRLVRDEKGLWEIDQPVLSRADQRHVSQLVDAVLNVRAEIFVADDVTEATIYGLDQPTLHVTIWVDDVDVGQTLYFGKPYEQDEDLIYAKRADDASVWTVRHDIVDRLGLQAETLRDRRLLTLTPRQIDGVILEKDERILDLKRSESSGWSIVRPGLWEADQTRVLTLLTDWTSASIERFYDPVSTNELAERFSSPYSSITFIRRDAQTGREQKTKIEVSASSPEEGRMTVRVMPEEACYDVSYSLMERLSLNPLHYRDPEVLALNSNTIKKITRLIGTNEQTVIRNEEAGFVASDRTGFQVDPSSVRHLLRSVTGLKVREYIADADQDLSIFGLDTPRMSLRFGLSGESGIGKTIVVGRKAGESGVYAMIQGQDAVFVLDDEVASVLTQRLYRVEDERSAEDLFEPDDADPPPPVED